MQVESAACPNCGRRIGDPVRAVAQSRLEQHLNTLAVLSMVVGGLFLIPGVGLMAFSGGLHLVVHDRESLAGLFPLLIYVGGSTFLILAAGGMCVGLA
jgi:hypothetical protein